MRGHSVLSLAPEDHTITPTSDVVATIANEDVALIMRENDVVTVGRDPESSIRVGHTPVYDDVVPRKAARLFCVGRRVVVANPSSRLAFDVSVDDRPPMVVRPGDWFSPPHHRFEIIVTGGAFRHELTVTMNSVGAKAHLAQSIAELADSEPLTGARPDLTVRQREIIDRYTDPVREGSSPASHQQVADALGISRSLVRLECNRIWSELLLTGVPMRDLPDKRDAIVDAWTRHRF